MYEVKPLIINRQNSEQLEFIDNYNVNYIMHEVYQAGKLKKTPKMSIGVLGYRNLDKTKRCVESVLKYVGDIDYELILMDNGSDDNNETYDYFQSVPTFKKKVIKVEEPLGSNYGSIYGTMLMYKFSVGDYFVFLGNDNIITENALQNMEKCLDSDVNIGLVTPMSSNAWMYQDPGLTYSSYEEMFEKAKQFNVYDPRKWQERLTIATVATAVKREAIDRIGFMDVFAEATLCFRMRQAGYKTILLGDTWVCHDHDYNTKNDSQPWIGQTDKAKFIRKRNEEIAKKYIGFGTFEDIFVVERNMLNLIDVNTYNSTPYLLSLDVRCGQGMLDLKNKLRESAIFNTDSIAYTTKAKYYKWLETVADQVCCDRIEFLVEVLDKCKFDYIIAGEPINLYNEPIKLLKNLLELLNKNGQLVFKVRNTTDYYSFIKILGIENSVDSEMPIHITYNDVINCAKYMGYNNITMSRELFNVNEQTINQLYEILSSMKIEGMNIKERVTDILTKNYYICIKKS